MKELYLWTNSIIVTVVIATIFELIIPEGKNKKYIKTIIGIFIVFSIISPVISNVLGKEITFSNLIETDMLFENNIKTLDTNKSVVSVLKENIKSEISSKIGQMGYSCKLINIVIDETDENMGEIKSVKIKVEKMQNNETVSKIKKVQIGENDNEDEVSKEELEKIKAYIVSDYNVKNVEVENG